MLCLSNERLASKSRKLSTDCAQSKSLVPEHTLSRLFFDIVNYYIILEFLLSETSQDQNLRIADRAHKRITTPSKLIQIDC